MSILHGMCVKIILGTATAGFGVMSACGTDATVTYISPTAAVPHCDQFACVRTQGLLTTATNGLDILQLPAVRQAPYQLVQ